MHNGNLNNTRFDDIGKPMKQTSSKVKIKYKNKKPGGRGGGKGRQWAELVRPGPFLLGPWA